MPMLMLMRGAMLTAQVVLRVRVAHTNLIEAYHDRPLSQLVLVRNLNDRICSVPVRELGLLNFGTPGEMINSYIV